MNQENADAAAAENHWMENVNEDANIAALDFRESAMHIITCSQPWFAHIAEDNKTVEGRKATEKWRKIKKGDVILFEEAEGSGRITKRVADVCRHSSLRFFLVNEGLRNVLPGIDTLEEAERVYGQWWHPSELFEGVLAIHLSR